MKVGYLTNCFGSQSHTFIRREIRALRALGVDVCLFGIREDKQNRADDADDLVAETRYLYPLDYADIAKQNLHYLKRSPRRYFRGAIRAFTSPEFGLRRRAKMLYHYFVAAHHARQIENQGVTHIHAHFLNVSASIAMYASWHSRIPFSVTVHSAGTYRTAHIIGVAQKLREAEFLIMISRHNIEYFDAIAPCRGKSHVVRCGIDLANFQMREQFPRVGAAEKYRLLAVGRFVEKKGFVHLIEAARLLKDRRIAFSLTFIGDGPLLDKVRERAAQLGLSGDVVFAGRQGAGEVRSAMAEAHVLIVPSVTSKTGEKEGLPVVIIEAMATGVPVVASDHSGIPEIVRPNETGYLTPEGDAHKIADAISTALESEPMKIVRNARDLVESEFDIMRVAEQRRELFIRHDFVDGGGRNRDCRRGSRSG
jgi:colanic acid/amylovoran biosynthesis glycosyltransferase